MTSSAGTCRRSSICCRRACRRSRRERCEPWAMRARNRPAALANLPTVAEQGLPGFDASSWMGLVAPAKTPAPVLARLSEEIARVLKEPDMIVRIRELGSEPGHAFGAAFGTFMHAETAKWAEVIRTSGAKAE